MKRMLRHEDKKRYLSWCPFHEEDHPVEDLWTINGYNIVKCSGSGLVYLANPLNEKDLAAYYSLKYFEGDSARKGYSSYTDDEFALRTNFRDLAQHVTGWLRRTKKKPEERSLLEIGCAYGYFLDEVHGSFKQVRGIEINEEVAKVGRERFGLTVESSSDAIASIEPDSLDTIIMWDVIEHLQRPRFVLKSCARGLAPGGVLFLTTGDIDSFLARIMGRRWRLVNPPQHIVYFSKRTLTSLLHECGFDVQEVCYPSRRVTLRFILFILQYMCGHLPSRILPRMNWLMRRSIRLNLFDVMLIVAVRR